MTISDIIKDLETLRQLEVAVPIIIISFFFCIGFIKVKEQTLWHYLFVKIGKDLNEEVLNQVKAVDGKVDKVASDLADHIKESEVSTMIQLRKKIIDFSDGIYQGKIYSKEAYEQILDYIRTYDNFCEENPDFAKENNKAKFAIGNINKNYEELLYAKEDAPRRFIEDSSESSEIIA